MTIISDPPGATVIVNGQLLGAAPVDLPSRSFLYYGKYDIQLFRTGYEPLRIQQEVKAPWYQWPGLDFISENLVPWHVKDHRVFTYEMLPARQVPMEHILENGERERARGQGLGMPLELPTPHWPQ